MSGSEEDVFAAILQELHKDPGNQSAWGDLFRRTWPFVLALSHRSLRDSRRHLLAEDVAQEVFLRFSRYWHEKRPGMVDRDSLLSLLAFMTRQTASDTGKWLTRRRRDMRREEPVNAADPPSSSDDTADVESQDLLDRFMRELDPHERRILHLRLQGYQFSEIAERTNGSKRSVERSMQVIRKKLAPYLQDE